MTNAAPRGKPDAGNPHVRFDEGEVAPAATPRRGSLLYTEQQGLDRIKRGGAVLWKWMEAHQLIVLGLLILLGLVVNGYLRSEPRYYYISSGSKVFDRRTGIVYFHGTEGIQYKKDYVAGKEYSVPWKVYK